MPVSHTIANYAKNKFNEESFSDLTYYMCFDDNFVFPVHYKYKEVAILEHWKVLATAVSQNLMEIVSEKTLTSVFATSKIVCPKEYIVVEGFNGKEFETLVLEIVNGVIDGGLTFDNEYSKQKGLLPYLAPGLVLCWLKGQDNYDELLPIYLDQGLVELPLEELEGFTQQVDPNYSVIFVAHETDDEN